MPQRLCIRKCSPQTARKRVASRALLASTMNHANTNHYTSSVVVLNLSMFKILHSDPGNNHPHPTHHSRQHHQCRIISNNWQSRIVFKLRRRVRRFAYIPCPTPDTQTAAHAYDDNNPGHDKDDPTPPFRLAIIPFVGGKVGTGSDDRSSEG